MERHLCQSVMLVIVTLGGIVCLMWFGCEWGGGIGITSAHIALGSTQSVMVVIKTPGGTLLYLLVVNDRRH